MEKNMETTVPVPTDTETRGQHTEGPWMMTDVRESGPYKVIAWVRNPNGHRWRKSIATILEGNLDDGEMEANASLICAAPDLLDALRAFCGDYKSLGFPIVALDTAYHHARNVIAKAEGHE